MDFLDNISADTLTISACVIAFLLTDDTSPAIQNSLGNFFMLIGQFLSTHAAQQQVVNNSNGTSNGSNEHTVNGNLSPTQMLEKVRDTFDQYVQNMQ